jgi:hypothetical protein
LIETATSFSISTPTECLKKEQSKTKRDKLRIWGLPKERQADHKGGSLFTRISPSVQIPHHSHAAAGISIKTHPAPL